MSNTDSFIEEVTEEVRRDRLFGLMRRYGWIGIVAVLAIVGGAAFSEWKKAENRASAEALGDAILSAVNEDDRDTRLAAFEAIDADGTDAKALVALLAAGDDAATHPAEAATRLLGLADDNSVTLIYRQIAILKAVALNESGLGPEERRTRLEGLALAPGVIRLLAEEQLAYLDIEEGKSDSALESLQQILADAEATVGLRQRAAQVIVALGGTPDFAAMADAMATTAGAGE